MSIRVAINGYGNLGRGVEQALLQAVDLEPVVVFTRRDPEQVETAGTPVAPLDQMSEWADKVDICINCGGSATDLETQTPAALEFFSVVDSFDTHAKIPEFFETVDQVARNRDRAAIISTGWDPGLFSLMRVLFEATLPNGHEETFWGRGVSQGHSDAIRRVPGVVDARQYTVPIEAAVESAISGDDRELTPRDKHLRECFVVAEEGADTEEIERQIKEMPNYFADYDTTVTFVSAEELAEQHSGLPHGGMVIRNGNTSEDNSETLQFQLRLDSNPEFTGSVLTAYARALYRLVEAGFRGAATALDIPVGALHPDSAADLRAHRL